MRSSSNTPKLDLNDKKIILPYSNNDFNKIQGSANQSVCVICTINTSQYICPNCNIPYCSLNCFKSEVHSDCNQNFTNNQLKDELSINNQSNLLEKKKALDLLKKFNEENDIDEFNEIDDDTMQRLASLDLESSDPSTILNALSKEERDQFENLTNPSNSATLTRLLHLYQQSFHPWYIDDDNNSENESDDLLDKPEAKSFDLHQGGEILSSNLVAIMFSYAFILRRFGLRYLSDLENTSRDIRDAKGELSRLLPFLKEKRSNFTYVNPREAVHSIWSRIPPEIRTKEFLDLLLDDTKCLLKPLKPVHEESDRVISTQCLFDILQVFGEAKTPFTTKLTFYLTRCHNMTAYLKKLNFNIDIDRHENPDN
ncbi:hypothetical protein E3Q17_00001 [Wallemia mellicola]|uniref:HIT-type domain-containing protein n=1 Tax=Wallemia mellicola TaxID=1708541 RepID=A0A4T0P4J1_9BASI|nr:hypothetical protein E3Q24_03011 [Wallemia mellicola]TIC05080.1 hypothetical protein E3Q17_00001 [Wallemia mellicola]TIC08132.1 hypothetical protein E3Q16_00001 [Wallemia mellicola]TIC20747.1 hypothetical protein E3Q13_00329 [Wallemia mellicola]TIC47301.1 hypothetical protein E3Q08_00001 [Wallemia mellicola]